MIKKGFLTLLAVSAVLLVTGIITVLSMPSPVPSPAPQAPVATSPSYQLNWDVMSSGGATMQSASFTMYSTTGQDVTTTMSGSSFTMKNGFWQGVFEQIYKLFLPQIRKG